MKGPIQLERVEADARDQFLKCQCLPEFGRYSKRAERAPTRLAVVVDTFIKVHVITVATTHRVCAVALVLSHVTQRRTLGQVTR